jgi:hypothetical protein
MELVYLLAEQHKRLDEIEFGAGPMSGTALREFTKEHQVDILLEEELRF